MNMNMPSYNYNNIYEPSYSYNNMDEPSYNFNNNYNNMIMPSYNYNNMNIFSKNNYNINSMKMERNVNLNTNVNLQNDYNNTNIKKISKKKEEIFVTFTFQKNKEQIYLDIDKYETFINAIAMLEKKYNWLKKIRVKKYINEKKEISQKDFNKTLNELGIQDNTDIIIVA